MQKSAPKRITLPEDDHWQKFLISRIAKKSLLVFSTVSGEHKGFITGIDDEWIQITTLADNDIVILSVNQLVSVRDTGYTLFSYPDYSNDDKIKVEGFMFALNKKAKEILEDERG